MKSDPTIEPKGVFTNSHVWDLDEDVNLEKTQTIPLTTRELTHMEFANRIKSYALKYRSRFDTQGRNTSDQKTLNNGIIGITSARPSLSGDPMYYGIAFYYQQNPIRPNRNVSIGLSYTEYKKRPSSSTWKLIRDSRPWLNGVRSLKVTDQPIRDIQFVPIRSGIEATFNELDSITGDISDIDLDDPIQFSLRPFYELRDLFNPRTVI